MFNPPKFVAATIPDKEDAAHRAALGDTSGTSLVETVVDISGADSNIVYENPLPTRYLVPPGLAPSLSTFAPGARSPPPLRNSGASCYFNSAIQALLSSPQFYNYLHDGCSTARVAGFNMLSELEAIVKASPSRPLDISGLSTRRITEVCKTFKPYAQEDAHEAVQAILNRCRGAELASQRTEGLAERSLRTTFTDQVFGGWQRQSCLCGSCGHETVRFTPFISLAVPLSKNLDGSLARYTGRIAVEGRACAKCGCERVSLATRVEEAPRSLVVCVNRFTVGHSGFGRKSGSRFAYPLELDLAPAMELPLGTGPVYDLVAVILHGGVSLDSGHYRCYQRTAQGAWLLRDDDHVARVAGARVIDSDAQREAYVMIYQRRDPAAAAGARPALLAKTGAASSSINAAADAAAIVTAAVAAAAPAEAAARARKHKHRASGKEDLGVALGAAATAAVAGVWQGAFATQAAGVAPAAAPAPAPAAELPLASRDRSVRAPKPETRATHREVVPAPVQPTVEDEGDQLSVHENTFPADAEEAAAAAAAAETRARTARIEQQAASAAEAAAAAAAVAAALHGDALLSGDGADLVKDENDRIIDLPKLRKTRATMENRARTAAELLAEEEAGLRRDQGRAFDRLHSDAALARREGRRTHISEEHEARARRVGAIARRHHFVKKMGHAAHGKKTSLKLQKEGKIQGHGSRPGGHGENRGGRPGGQNRGHKAHGHSKR